MQEYLLRELDLAQVDYSMLTFAFKRFGALFTAMFRWPITSSSSSAGDGEKLPREMELFLADVYQFTWMFTLALKGRRVREGNRTSHCQNYPRMHRNAD